MPLIFIRKVCSQLSSGPVQGPIAMVQTRRIGSKRRLMLEELHVPAIFGPSLQRMNNRLCRFTLYLRRTSRGCLAPG
jgi:hypothetical protein